MDETRDSRTVAEGFTDCFLLLWVLVEVRNARTGQRKVLGKMTNIEKTDGNGDAERKDMREPPPHFVKRNKHLQRQRSDETKHAFAKTDK